MTITQAVLQLKIYGFACLKTLSSRLCQNVIFSWINGQKPADHIKIISTLDSYSSVSGEINKFWCKRLDRLFKLQSD